MNNLKHGTFSSSLKSSSVKMASPENKKGLYSLEKHAIWSEQFYFYFMNKLSGFGFPLLDSVEKDFELRF